MLDGLAQLRTQLGKILDKWQNGLVVDVIYAAYKFEVVEPGQVVREGAGERERPGNAHAAPDAAGCRAFGAADEPYQRGLAGPVSTENAYVLAALEREIDVLEDLPPSMARIVGLADVLQGQHQNSIL